MVFYIAKNGKTIRQGWNPLLPKTKRRWAIKVFGNWRLTFEFMDGDALNVDIELWYYAREISLLMFDSDLV